MINVEKWSKITKIVQNKYKIFFEPPNAKPRATLCNKICLGLSKKMYLENFWQFTKPLNRISEEEDLKI